VACYTNTQIHVPTNKLIKY